MTHPIRRVVTGARREGPRGRHLRWSGPVRACQQARTGLVFGGHLARSRRRPGSLQTSIRGTGVGWSQVVGRLGSLFGPLIGGVLVSRKA
jgi:hypothetical protein